MWLHVRFDTALLSQKQNNRLTNQHRILSLRIRERCCTTVVFAKLINDSARQTDNRHAPVPSLPAFDRDSNRRHESWAVCGRAFGRHRRAGRLNIDVITNHRPGLDPPGTKRPFADISVLTCCDEQTDRHARDTDRRNEWSIEKAGDLILHFGRPIRACQFFVVYSACAPQRWYRGGALTVGGIGDWRRSVSAKRWNCQSCPHPVSNK